MGENEEAVRAIYETELMLCSVQVVEEEASSEIAGRDESAFHVLILPIDGGS